MFHLDHDEFAELKLLVPGFPLFAWTLTLPQSSLDLCHAVLCVHDNYKGGCECAVDVRDKVHQLV